MAELPDPFLFTNGQRVRSQDEWRARREQIKGILQRYQYGRMAPAPEEMPSTIHRNDRSRSC